MLFLFSLALKKFRVLHPITVAYRLRLTLFYYEATFATLRLVKDSVFFGACDCEMVIGLETIDVELLSICGEKC